MWTHKDTVQSKGARGHGLFQYSTKSNHGHDSPPYPACERNSTALSGGGRWATCRAPTRFPGNQLRLAASDSCVGEKYRVIAPDLRGYGETDKPASGYDKRTMAADTLALLQALGIERIALVGHDRGARVATRFAKDHPAVVNRLVVMDNVPTRIVARSMNAQTARAYWFFFFHLVPELPETLIAGKEDL